MKRLLQLRPVLRVEVDCIFSSNPTATAAGAGRHRMEQDKGLLMQSLDLLLQQSPTLNRGLNEDRGNSNSVNSICSNVDSNRVTASCGYQGTTIDTAADGATENIYKRKSTPSEPNDDVPIFDISRSALNRPSTGEVQSHNNFNTSDQ